MKRIPYLFILLFFAVGHYPAIAADVPLDKVKMLTLRNLFFVDKVDVFDELSDTGKEILLPKTFTPSLEQIIIKENGKWVLYFENDAIFEKSGASQDAFIVESVLKGKKPYRACVNADHKPGAPPKSYQEGLSPCDRNDANWKYIWVATKDSSLSGTIDLYRVLAKYHIGKGGSIEKNQLDYYRSILLSGQSLQLPASQKEALQLKLAKLYMQLPSDTRIKIDNNFTRDQLNEFRQLEQKLKLESQFKNY